jgi:hypothetical protein
VVSILAKAPPPSPDEDLAGERQYIGCLTAHAVSTATESSAAAFAALTPPKTMETSEAEQDDSKPMAEASDAEKLLSPQEPSWKGWAELENDPVASHPFSEIFWGGVPFAKMHDRPFLVSCYKNGALKVCKSEKSYR